VVLVKLLRLEGKVSMLRMTCMWCDGRKIGARHARYARGLERASQGRVQLFALLVRYSSTARLFALVGKKNPLCTPKLLDPCPNASICAEKCAKCAVP
jgi:hypothetical protein